MNEIGIDLKQHIRTIPDWPKKGVMFRDISSLLEDRLVFRKLIDLFVHRYFTTTIDAVVGIDARGFIIGAPLAYELNAGFIPVRKKGQLPGKTISEAYALENGEAEVEIQTDWLQPGYRVILIDDLIATGGTRRRQQHGCQQKNEGADQAHWDKVHLSSFGRGPESVRS